MLGTPADSGQGVMRSFFLTNADSPPPGHCLSSDDLAALNYLYPSCANPSPTPSPNPSPTPYQGLGMMFCRMALGDPAKVSSLGQVSATITNPNPNANPNPYP